MNDTWLLDTLHYCRIVGSNQQIDSDTINEITQHIAANSLTRLDDLAARYPPKAYARARFVHAHIEWQRQQRRQRSESSQRHRTLFDCNPGDQWAAARHAEQAAIRNDIQRRLDSCDDYKVRIAAHIIMNDEAISEWATEHGYARETVSRWISASIPKLQSLLADYNEGHRP
jgi:DNA-directed RNA polymerase specialized sigma24 family protein